MHDKFEDEVRGKMEGWSLPPSEPVWTKVEAEIRPQQRRRRIVFWFLLAALTFSGGWWGYHRFAHGVAGNPQNVAVEAPLTPAQPKPVFPDKKMESPGTVGTQKTTPITNDAVPTEAGETITNRTQPSLSNGRTVHPSTPQNPQPNTANQTVPKINVEIRTLTSEPLQTRVVLNQKRSEYTAPKNDAVSVQSENPEDPRATADGKDSTPIRQHKFSAVKQEAVDSSVKKVVAASRPLVDSIRPTTSPLPAPSAVDSTFKKKIAVGRKKWTKLVLFQVGSSSAASGRFSSPAQFSPVSGAGNPGANQGGTPPSKASPGLQLGLRFGLEKPLSRRWYMGFGIEAAYASTRTQIGAQQSASATVAFNNATIRVADFYGNGTADTYTNRFLSVGTPVWITYQPFRLPLTLSAGAGYRYLVWSNALTYNPSAKIWYRNANNNNRHQLPLSASVQYGFAVKNVVVKAGPVYEHNLLKVQKEDARGATRLRFVGVRAGVSF